MPSRLLGNLPTNCFAVFEVAKPTPDLFSVLGPLHSSLQFSRADVEPAGFAWFLLLVPDEPSKRQWAIAAQTLRSVAAAGRDGRLQELRIVHGAHLISLAETVLEAPDHLFSGTASRLPLAGSDDGQSEGGS